MDNSSIGVIARTEAETVANISGHITARKNTLDQADFFDRETEMPFHIISINLK
ncbi:hypothetical protein GCM10007876_02820 [Litoribrevibacter albus]|uniref:Uncharacterized protein n=1 Tax=Litoribrevibacter albus TaxID=1473156 RepID=A0AA37W6E8_9GAMM|nr:hypothetical protein GCM10007876_02820 [Litoribrevibacter albus]